MTRASKDLGDHGENLAADWYEALGYVVVDRNWRTRSGEIDLIVLKDKTVAFVEVKVRSSDRHGGGVAAVGWKKQQTIRMTATAWLRAQAVAFDEVRFDVIDIGPRDQITPYVGCF